MEITVSCDAGKAAAGLGKTAQQIEKAAGKAIRDATRVLFEEDRRQVNVIYARAIPVSSKGRALWKRKDTLRRGEVMSFPGALSGFIGNDTPYAPFRHALNRPGAGGVTRYDPWREKTVAIASPKAIQAFEDTFKKELES